MYKTHLPRILFLLTIFLFFPKKNDAQSATDSIAKLDLLFVGDVMQHIEQIEAAEIIKNKKYNFSPCFRYVQPIIEQADLAIANLEVTLPGAPPYHGYPNFRSPDALATALRKAGFDMLVTANNHSNDAGKNGVLHTINTIQKNGFYQTGTFKNAEERELFYPLMVYKNNFKIAFLNYTFGTNQIATVPPTIVNRIDTTLIKADMKMARAMQPDAIIAIMHWGKEYQLLENQKQQKLAQQIFNWGADLVIGMHPHVVQPIRTSEQEQLDGFLKKKLVAYSLGNFISGQSIPNTDGGLIFEVTLEKNIRTQKVTIGTHHWIPVWRYVHVGEKNKLSFFAVPISAFENGNEALLGMNELSKNAMQNFAKKTRAHLNQFHSLERKITLEELGEIQKLEMTKPIPANSKFYKK